MWSIGVLKLFDMNKSEDIITATKRDKNPFSNNAKNRIKRDLTSAEEKEAFLYTSKVNSVRIFAKYAKY